MENDKKFEQKLVQILAPFFQYVKEFEKRTGLAINPNEPLGNYGLNTLFGKNLLDLYNLYLELTFVRNISNSADFGDELNGNESLKENPRAEQGS